jgi:hypothetical protein
MQYVINYIFIFVDPAESKKHPSDILLLCKLSTRQCRPTFIYEAFFMFFTDNLSLAFRNKDTIRCQTRACGICETKGGTGNGLISRPSVSPCRCHSANVPFLWLHLPQTLFPYSQMNLVQTLHNFFQLLPKSCSHSSLLPRIFHASPNSSFPNIPSSKTNKKQSVTFLLCCVT